MKEFARLDGLFFSVWVKLYLRWTVLYYSGRNNPPHPEVWVNYFLRMVLLYSNKICELSESSAEDVEISG